MPKFLLMVNHEDGDINTPMEEWDPSDVSAHISYYDALNNELTENGGMRLADPRQARIVKSDGESAPVVAYGPFPESKEILAGFRMENSGEDL